MSFERVIHLSDLGKYLLGIYIHFWVKGQSLYKATHSVMPPISWPILYRSDVENMMSKYPHRILFQPKIWMYSLQAILCAGLYPNVAAGEQGIVATALSSLKRSPSSVNSSRTFWFDGRREVHLHPSSINSNTKVFKHPFLVFLEKVCNVFT